MRKPLTLPQRLAAHFTDAACLPTPEHTEGPFYRPNAPRLTDLYPAGSHGRVLYFHGIVTGIDCQPLATATGEIWQADELGRYDNDDPANPPAPDFFRGRATFSAGSDGTFVLRTVLPANYSVCDPNTPWKRTKHLHFKLHAPAHQPLTTEIALLPDQYVAHDPLFDRSLGCDLETIGEENGRAAHRARFHFALKPVSSRGYALAALARQSHSDAAAMTFAAGPAGSSRTRHIVRHPGVAIEVICEGAGPLIVLLPSSGRDSEDFDDVAAGLAVAGFRVLRPQPRGIGCSAGPLQGMTLQDFARDVAAAIAHENAGPAAIVGHAFGNWVARMTAVDHPGLVRGVVLAAAAAKTIPEEMRGAVAKCASPTLSDAERLRYLQFAFFATGNDPSAWLTGWHLPTMESQRQAGGTPPQDVWWPAGAAPILDLQGLNDPWRPRSTADEMKAEFGDRVQVIGVPNTSHALFPERPSVVVNEIAAWVRKL